MTKPAGQVAGDDIDAQPAMPREQVQAASAIGRAELSGKLAGLSLRQQVVVLAIWPLMEQVLNFLVGTTDMVIAGHLEPVSVAVSATDALGSSAYIGWLMTILHSAVGVGAVALVARAVGARHRRLANACVGQAMLLALIGGMAVGAIMYVAAPTISRWSGLSGDSLNFAVVYLRVVTLASPFSALLLVGNSCLRGAGDTRTPFLVMVVVNIVNIGMSLLLVYAPAPLGGHGVAGIAGGTAIAWAIGSVVVLIVLFRGWGGVRLYWHRLRPHWHTIRRIVRIASPNLFESFGAMWLGNFLVLMIVGELGQKGLIGAHNITIRIESFSFLPGFAIGAAAATLTGQYLGLGDPQRAKRAVYIAWYYAAVMMTVCGLIFIAFPRQLISLITQAPLLIDLAETPVRLCGPIQIFFACHAVFGSALRGAGDTRSTFFITATMTFLVRLPVVYLFAITFDMGLTGVWIALCIELALRGMATAAVFLRGRWMGLKV